MKPVKKSSYHHGNLRQSIIDAVAHLIRKKKGLNFQLKEIALLVGTSQPAIYKHFNGKKDLLTEVAVEGYQIQSDLREQAINNASDSPLAKVKAVGYSYFDFAQNYPGYFLLIKNLETKEILSSKRYLELRKKTIDRVHTLTQQCMDEKIFIKKDLILLVVALNAVVYGLAHMHITGQIGVFSENLADNQKFYRQVLDIHISALLTEKGKIEFDKY
jgi:AcrR family transcriptional regulator